MPDHSSKKKRPRDTNQLAKQIVDEATDGTPESEREDDGQSDKDSAAVELGRRGGLKGGKARAKKLTARQRSDIARRAAIARWKSSGKS